MSNQGNITIIWCLVVGSTRADLVGDSGRVESHYSKQVSQRLLIQESVQDAQLGNGVTYCEVWSHYSKPARVLTTLGVGSLYPYLCNWALAQPIIHILMLTLICGQDFPYPNIRYKQWRAQLTWASQSQRHMMELRHRWERRKGWNRPLGLMARVGLGGSEGHRIVIML